MDSVRHDQFARIFLQCQGRVYGYIVTMLPNRHDAEDVFQQTSLILWQKWDQFDPQPPEKGDCPDFCVSKNGTVPSDCMFSERDFLSWACGVARNEVRNFLRCSGRDRVVLSERLMNDLAEVRLEVQPLLEQRRTLLVECMKKLDFMARELLERCYRGGQTMKAIARQFRTTPNALYLRLRRIRRELLECVEQKTNQEDSP